MGTNSETSFIFFRIGGAPLSNIQLTANLFRLRTEYNLTQTQISKKLNISRQAYSNYETGKRIPDIDMLVRIADFYHITLEELVTQPCSRDGVINENSGPYHIGIEIISGNTIYLTEEEVELLTHFRNAAEDDRRLTKKVLEM